MSLYPSLEDMKVDHMAVAQQELHFPNYVEAHQRLESTNDKMLYPGLGEYMGMELSLDVIRQNMPEYLPSSQNFSANNATGGVIAPLSSSSPALSRAFVTQAVKQLILCKDGDGKIGLRLREVSSGLFVSLVIKDSPAALAGLRFGDQILQIGNTAVAGMTMEKAHKILKDSPINGITLAVRDRPFERTITLHKDSLGTVGFHFKDGKIIGLVKDSSAARNGLLTDHQILEVNAQNVVGLKDKEISRIIDESPSVVTLTIIPFLIYKHMIDKMATSLLKGSMDHAPAV